MKKEGIHGAGAPLREIQERVRKGDIAMGFVYPCPNLRGGSSQWHHSFSTIANLIVIELAKKENINIVF